MPSVLLLFHSCSHCVKFCRDFFPLPFFWLRRFLSLSPGFLRVHFTTIHCFGILLGSNFRLRNHFCDVRLSFARHGWDHRSFQLSPRIFENFFVLCVIWIDKVNSSQSSSIVEFWLLVCPFLFFSILSGFPNFRPYFWPYMIWSGSRLNLFPSRRGPHISFWRFLLQYSELCESFPRILTDVCSNRHFNNRQSAS